MEEGFQCKGNGCNYVIRNKVRQLIAAGIAHEYTNNYDTVWYIKIVMQTSLVIMNNLNTLRNVTLLPNSSPSKSLFLCSLSPPPSLPPLLLCTHAQDFLKSFMIFCMVFLQQIDLQETLYLYKCMQEDVNNIEYVNRPDKSCFLKCTARTLPALPIIFDNHTHWILCKS